MKSSRYPQFQSSKMLVEFIAQEVFNNDPFEYSWGETFAALNFIIFSGYLAYESSKVYMDIGGPGTRYMPFEMSEQFGGFAAFSCNFTLYLYFIVDTAISGRNAARRDQFYQRIGIKVPQSKKIKKITKLSAAALLAILSGAVMSLIAGGTENLYNMVITGAVNSVLNYYGCIALLDGSSYILNKGKKKFYQYTNPTGSQYLIHTERQSDFKAQLELLEKATTRLEKLSNQNPIWNEIATPAGYIKFVNNPEKGKYTDIDINFNSTANKNSYQSMKWYSKGFIHAIMQTADKIALYGYWMETLFQTGKQFRLAMTTAALFALVIFSPFFMLSTKITYDTTKSIMSLVKTGYQKITNFIKNPNCSEETAPSFFITLLAIAIGCFCYALAFVSSNSTLELNATHGLNTWWSVLASLLAVTIFNGFGFLEIIMQLTATTKEYLFYDPLPKGGYQFSKKIQIEKHRHITDLFKNSPEEPPDQPTPVTITPYICPAQI